MSAGNDLTDPLHMAEAAAQGIIDRLGAFSVDPGDCLVAPLIEGTARHPNGPVGAVVVKVRDDEPSMGGATYTVLVL